MQDIFNILYIYIYVIYVYNYNIQIYHYNILIILFKIINNFLFYLIVWELYDNFSIWKCYVMYKCIEIEEKYVENIL